MSTTHMTFEPSKAATLDAAIRLASVNARIGTPGAAERLAELLAIREEGNLWMPGDSPEDQS